MSDDTLFNFPCDFPLKIIGFRHDEFAQKILEVILKHAPDFDGTTMEIRPSSQQKYISITCTIRAQSRAQLDALYRELTAQPMVEFVL